MATLQIVRFAIRRSFRADARLPQSISGVRYYVRPWTRFLGPEQYESEQSEPRKRTEDDMGYIWWIKVIALVILIVVWLVKKYS